LKIQQEIDHCRQELRKVVIRKDCTRAKIEQVTQRVGPLRKNLRTHHERKSGTKDLGGKWLLYVRKQRATTISIGGWSSRQLSPLERRVLAYKTLKKTLGLVITERANGMARGFQKIRKWTSWRGRPHPKQKRDRA
jgi:hypothetical protein